MKTTQNKEMLYQTTKPELHWSWRQTLEHFMWLQPSFFCIGDLQLEQGFELVTSHRQLAEFSKASSVPDTMHNVQYKIQFVTMFYTMFSLRLVMIKNQ